MKRVRAWLAVLIVWLFFFYSIEKVSGPVNLAPFIYVFVFISALIVLMVKPLVPVRLVWFYVAAFPVYLLLKQWTGSPILGANLPVTITELCGIALTMLLTSQVINRFREVEDTLYRLTMDPERKETYPFEIGQSQIYREIRRARKRNKPLSLLSITVSEHSLKMNISRFMQEFQREIIRRYVNARLGNLLVEKLHGTDIITQRNDHFVILLPDTERADAYKVMSRLQSTAHADLGVAIKIGVSAFPEEATTFERLLETAEVKMKDTVEGEIQLPQPEERNIGNAVKA